MKSIFLALALCISYGICFSQTYSIREYLSKNCNDAACVQSFFESKGFGKKVIWDKEPVLVREERILNEAAVAGSVNVVKGGITDNDLYCLFGTNDKATFDNLLQEANQLGFKQNAYRIEDYGEMKFYQSDSHKDYSIGAAAVVKGSGTYKFKYWVSIRKFKVIVKKDPNRELLAQIQKVAKPQKFTNVHKLFYYEKFISAETEAKKNIKANPASAEDHYWLIVSQLALKKLNEAKSSSAAASTSTKNHPLVMVAKGHILLQENKKDEARKLFDAALKAGDDKNGLVRIAVAKAYAEAPANKGDEAFGIQVITQAADAGISNPEMLVTLGMLYRRSIGLYTQAFMAYEMAAKIDPSYAKGYYMNGKTFQSQDNEAAMNRYYSDAIKSDPQYAPAYLALHQYYSQKDINKAIENLTQYLKYSDPVCDNDIYAAEFLHRVGKYNESLAKAQESEKGICKQNARTKLLKAYNYYMLGDSLQAKNLMEDFFSSESPAKIYSNDYRFAGELNARFKGAEPVAEKYFKKAIAADTIPYWQMRSARACAAMFEKINDFKKTAEWYQQIVNMLPDPSNTDLFKLGTAYYFSRDYNNSQKVFETYSQKFPADWRGPLWQARSFSMIDSTMTVAAAAPYYEKFISLGVADPVALKSLVEAYMYLAVYQYNFKKNKTTALGYLDKVLAIEPGHENAKKYKETITSSAN